MIDRPPEAFAASVLVGLKTADIASRSLFVLLATYALPLTQAGQFGLISTLCTLFAFASAFERHLDIQRRAAGEGRQQLERAVTRALPFFAFNWSICAPLFVVIAALWSGAGWGLVVPVAIVMVGENLATQSYNLSVMASRYFPFIALVAFKNMALAAVIAWRTFFWDSDIDLAFILNAWVVANAISIGVLVFLWRTIRAPDPDRPRFHLPREVFDQHRASMTHFLIGVVAVLMIQFDRLAVTALLGLDGGGRYLRHAILVSLAYQAFNIVIFTRLSPVIFAMAKQSPVARLQARLRPQYGLVIAGVTGLVIAAWAVDQATAGAYTARFQVSVAIMAAMLIAFLLRAAADFQGLILNARHRERTMLYNQGLAFGVAAVLLILLTTLFGIAGAVAANAVGAALYLVLNYRAVRRLD